MTSAHAQLNDRLSRLPADRREAWATRFLRELEADHEDPLLDTLTPQQAERLRGLLREGTESLDRGEATEWNTEVFIREAREERAARP